MIEPKRMSKARLLELINSSDLRANVSESTIDELLAHIAFLESEAIAAAFDAGVWAHKYQYHTLPTGPRLCGPTGGHMSEQPEFRFNGPAYEPKHDRARLTGQILRVYRAMSDGHWRTLGEIARLTGDPEGSVSAQLRHLRKERFGSSNVDRRARGDRSHGLWEYRLEASDATRALIE